MKNFPSKEGYKLEEPDLLPSFHSLRPDDITLHSNIDPLSNILNFKSQGNDIDCAIIRILLTRKTTPSSLQTANNNMLKHHLRRESKNKIDLHRKLDP